MNKVRKGRIEEISTEAEADRISSEMASNRQGVEATSVLEDGKWW